MLAESILPPTISMLSNVGTPIFCPSCAEYRRRGVFRAHLRAPTSQIWRHPRRRRAPAAPAPRWTKFLTLGMATDMMLVVLGHSKIHAQRRHVPGHCSH